MTVVLLLVNGSLIAGIFALAKFAGAAGVSPLGVLAWQLLFATPIVTAVAAASGRLPPLNRVSIRYAGIAGLLGISAPNLVSFTALAHVPAGVIGVIAALSPVFTYALALALRIERPRWTRALGIAVGLAGVLVLLQPRSALPGAATLPWALLALAGPLLLAGGNLFRSLAWPAGLHPLSAASLMLSIQALLLVPAALWRDELVLPRTTGDAADLALLGAGALATALYLSMFELQKRAGPILVGQLGYVITAASLLLGVLVFGERHGFVTIAAVAAVFAGVMLVRHGAEAPVARRTAPVAGCAR